MEKGVVEKRYQLLAIGGSAGSLRAIIKFLPDVRRDIHFAILLIVHRRSGPDNLLIDLLSVKTQITVKEADEKEPIRPGVIYVAPSDYHLLIEKDRTISLDNSEKVNFSRPSIDVTFESAADVYGKGLVCMLLSGANADGAAGMKTAKEHGALIVVQNPDDAEMAVMPNSALHSGIVDHVLDKEDIADFINKLF